MACANATARVAVKVLVEQRQIAPVRVAGVSLVVAVAGATA